MSLSVNDVDFGEQNIIYVTAPDKEKSYGVEWTAPSTENLLKYLKRYLKLFESGKLKTKKQLYENISAAMEEKGMFYSSAQCENKWKSLKRTYMTRYDKGNSSTRRFLVAKAGYDDLVEELLKIEKPSFKREIELTSVNLNVPPGFTKIEPESGSENEDDQVHVYTEKDEQLVQMVLGEPNSADSDMKEDTKDFKFIPSQSDDEHNYSSYSHNVENEDSNRLVEEVIELKKVIKKNLTANTEVLRNHNATHEQILTYLDTVEKRKEEKMEIKRRKLDKQDEVIQQLKIQNSLIAKLIQKIGNKPV